MKRRNQRFSQKSTSPESLLVQVAPPVQDPVALPVQVPVAHRKIQTRLTPQKAFLLLRLMLPANLLWRKKQRTPLNLQKTDISTRKWLTEVMTKPSLFRVKMVNTFPIKRNEEAKALPE